jgi:hypothetical protein
MDSDKNLVTCPSPGCGEVFSLDDRAQRGAGAGAGGDGPAAGVGAGSGGGVGGSIKELDADGRPLTAEAYAHFQANRLRCRTCNHNFCVKCKKMPYHKGKRRRFSTLTIPAYSRGFFVLKCRVDVWCLPSHARSLFFFLFSFLPVFDSGAGSASPLVCRVSLALFILWLYGSRLCVRARAHVLHPGFTCEGWKAYQASRRCRFCQAQISADRSNAAAFLNDAAAAASPALRDVCNAEARPRGGAENRNACVGAGKRRVTCRCCALCACA